MRICDECEQKYLNKMLANEYLLTKKIYDEEL